MKQRASFHFGWAVPIAYFGGCGGGVYFEKEFSCAGVGWCVAAFRVWGGGGGGGGGENVYLPVRYLRTLRRGGVGGKMYASVLCVAVEWV